MNIYNLGMTAMMIVAIGKVTIIFILLKMPCNKQTYNLAMAAISKDTITFIIVKYEVTRAHLLAN